MAISSNSLFQFTSRRETIEAILKSGFLWPKYCTEYYWGSFRFALPMVCLCDIPLSEISTHIDHYGKFGIGFSKKWAESIKELATVIYIRRNSSLYSKVLKILRKKAKGETLSASDIFLLSRIKKYSGNTYASPDGKRKIINKVRFYNEREWRYVPKDLSDLDILIENNQDEKPIEGDNDKTKGNPIFSLNDVRYLIVKDDVDRINLIKFIDHELSLKNDSDVILLLKSKILTIGQIKEDF